MTAEQQHGRSGRECLHAVGVLALPTLLETGAPLGACLVTERHGYHHHGIYVGRERWCGVVRCAGLAGSLHRGHGGDHATSK